VKVSIFIDVLGVQTKAVWGDIRKNGTVKNDSK